jgi:hypothetical protein
VPIDNRFGRHENLDLRPGRDHDVLRTARSTAMSTEGSTGPMTRTTASPIAISTAPEAVRGGGDDGEAAAITTGANAGVSSPRPDNRTCRSVRRCSGAGTSSA